MRASELQAEVIARLLASPTLAPFMPVFVEDGLTDAEEAIDSAVSRCGVFIGITRADVTVSAQSNSALVFAHDAAFSIYAWETPQNTTETKGHALREAIQDAITQHGNQAMNPIIPGPASLVDGQGVSIIEASYTATVF